MELYLKKHINKNISVKKYNRNEGNNFSYTHVNYRKKKQKKTEAQFSS